MAAGLGKRMKSKRHKVVHDVCGKPMIQHIVTCLQAVGFDRLFVVVGSLEEQVRAVLDDTVTFVRQEQQKGTGHAVQQVLPHLPADGIVLTLYGDCPLITPHEVERLVSIAQTEGATAMLTASVERPHGFGRIVRGADGGVLEIVEEKNATAKQRLIREVNTGFYAFLAEDLRRSLPLLTDDNAQGEYLLTDCIAHIVRAGGRVVPVPVANVDDIANVNDRLELSIAEARMRKRILERHMRAGVTIVDPEHTYVGADVVIGCDTVLYPGVHLTGATVVGEDARIGPDASIADCVIADRAVVRASVLEGSTVCEGATIGPFAYVRPGSRIGERVKIGDFVEVKNANIGADTKVSHLTYVGDADLGNNVNLGCGVVTVNFDGVRKHRTVVADDAFVGCNVNLVAPVSIGQGAYVAAGSTVTDDVPADAFAIARERQTTKPHYAAGLRARYTDRS
ncbi:MAG: bifunctional UDP-N-acetylglucosamine diphosphorylase/glucosamine-1-phosphate N-acetyltransferase GlmU [Firmicutes bacterium]|nr:bifunctional UDP-N-acetylglucosamine diphosphorylase/glucosamine-1-phosphate N-acetyltransferase GlmU [Bacillota bacterium]